MRAFSAKPRWVNLSFHHESGPQASDSRIADHLRCTRYVLDNLPEKRTRQLRPRQPFDLLYIRDVRKLLPGLLLDTTVYIDALQGRFPADADAVLRARGSANIVIASSKEAPCFTLFASPFLESQSN